MTKRLIPKHLWLCRQSWPLLARDYFLFCWLLTLFFATGEVCRTKKCWLEPAFFLPWLLWEQRSIFGKMKKPPIFKILLKIRCRAKVFAATPYANLI